MNKDTDLELLLINKIMNNYNLDFAAAKSAYQAMRHRNLIPVIPSSKEAAESLLKNEVNSYLKPCGFYRFKKYSDDELNKLGVKLIYLREKNDGWGTKLYSDEKTGLVWEDAPGRYSNEGYQLATD